MNADAKHKLIRHYAMRIAVLLVQLDGPLLPLCGCAVSPGIEKR